MKEEIAAAVVFLKRLIKKNESLSEDQIQKYCDNLSALLVERFRNHWYDDKPMKGQAYRCIRINDSGPVDSVLDKAAVSSGLCYSDLQLPPELTLWVDPKEVCCRFGELKGYCFTVASFKNGSNDNKASTLDIDDLLETQKQQRLDDLTRLQHHTSRRSNRNKPTNQKFRKNVQNCGSGVSNHGKTHPKMYKWCKDVIPVQSPLAASPATARKNFTQQMQYFTNSIQPDPFHWVRGHDLVKA